MVNTSKCVIYIGYILLDKLEANLTLFGSKIDILNGDSPVEHCGTHYIGKTAIMIGIPWNLKLYFKIINKSELGI